MRGVFVGLGIAVFCLLIAVQLILHARHRGEPWLTHEEPFGLVPGALLTVAAIGVLVAVISAISAVLG